MEKESKEKQNRNQSLIIIGVVVIFIIILIAIFTQKNTITRQSHVDNSQNSQQAEIDSLKNQIQDLKENPANQQIATTSPIDINLQNECSGSASEYFKEHTSDLTMNGMPTPTYINHWNKSLNKCFILTTSTAPNEKTNGFIISQFLIDVTEGKYYGSIYKDTDAVIDCSINKNGEISSLYANLNDIKNRQYCNSQEEFDSLINPYIKN